MKRCFLLFLALAALALPVDAQVFTQPRFVGPDGQKKVGQYVWVWHTEHIPISHSKPVEVDCPAGYVVTGGGYHQSYGFAVYETMPTPAFDGWVVDTSYLYGQSGPNTVTVYAGCAPAK